MEKFRMWLLRKDLKKLSRLNLILTVVMYLVGIFLIPEFLLLELIVLELALLFMSFNENKELLKEDISLIKILFLEFPFVYFNIIFVASIIFNKYLDNIFFIVVCLVICGVISKKINKVVRKYLYF